jgi:hypothetical protein
LEPAHFLFLGIDAEALRMGFASFLGRCVVRGVIILCVFACGMSTAAVAGTRALLVVGLGGTEEYAQEFQRDAEALDGHMRAVADDVVLLASGEREQVASELAAFASRTDPHDSFVFIYVGHGSYDGEAFRFNVTGRDFTGVELNQWLNKIDAKHQLVVVTGSSSGALLETMARDKRTTITATRSGEQKNATVFGRYFSAALSDDSADVNKDQRISASEAFDYAKSKVEGLYEEENEMATEHPQSQGPAPVIVLAQLGSKALDPGLADLVAQRESFELEIEQLKAKKSGLASDEYFAQLQDLLLGLAAVEGRIDAGQIEASNETDAPNEASEL